jgi:ABC-type transport system involved in Fe-S cluster assembly fused permease/ATPase subunit
MNAINVSQQMIIGVTNFACLAFCIYDIIDKDLQVGVFVTVQIFLVQIFAPLFFLGTIFNMAITGFVDMYHFCKLMQEDNIIRDAPNATILNVSNPSIEFKNVYFK